MKNGKYSKNSGAKAGLNKSLALVLVLVLVLGCAVGGTIAWFTDKTDDVVNTFTVGNIDIKLEETWNTDADGDGTNDSWSAALIPGFTYTKDPKVTVEAGSEDCWLFVKFVEKNSPSDYLTYTSTLTEANGWTQGDGTEIPADVWYREVSKSETDFVRYLLEGTGNGDLKNGYVTVKDTVVKAGSTSGVVMPDAANTPELSYTAYAVQLYKTNGVKFTAAEAWDIAPTT